MKKLVPNSRSNTSIRQAAVRAGKASSPRIATSSIAHMVRGSRIIDSPGARMLTMVVTKLSPPMVKDAMKSTMPTIQRVCPMSEPGIAPLSADSGG